MERTDRTQLKRRAQRGNHDRAVIDAILDEALVCHVAFTAPHGPMVIPTTHVRIDNHLYLHGAASNAMLSTSSEVCVCVTLLDALVMGKTAMHHSVNYRSVIAFGRATRVDDPDAKRTILAALLEKVEPGRSERCRPPNPTELAITQVVGIPLTEASAKIRTGPPVAEEGDDANLPHWSGIVPIVTLRGSPIMAPRK